MNLERVLDSINVKIDEIHDQIYSEDLTLEKYDIIAKKLKELEEIITFNKNLEMSVIISLNKSNKVNKFALILILLSAGLFFISSSYLVVIELLLAYLMSKEIKETNKEIETITKETEQLDSLLKDVLYKQDISQKRKKRLERKIELQRNIAEDKTLLIESPHIPHMSQIRVLKLQKK